MLTHVCVWWELGANLIVGCEPFLVLSHSSIPSRADLLFSRETRRETAMAKDILGEAGLHFDELNKLRVLDPEVTQQTTELKEECKDFVDKIGQFQKIVGGLIELVDQLAKEAENEKMKAIGARNLLKSIAKQREAQQQQLQALIAEKKMQLERYRVEYEALCKVEAEQNEFIDQFIFQK
ncbi:PREDICTED: intraflagellar transport protein 20 homolog isoform X1 [Hipposideros armiger]|uniref:Intraflagellar transport protein 20 homolog isoform X1 n=1 Tax=Hipposideros armiger TaxID=186990 RepID=A0A8B7RNA9_HIPAR|nr:PREDICTED: intraflagellar transport protein 20 homolog isoform X1 [Hipposideros armiger]